MIVSGLTDDEYRLTAAMGDGALESLARSHVGEAEAARAARRISDPLILVNLLRDPAIRSGAVQQAALSGLILSAEHLSEVADTAADPAIRKRAAALLGQTDSPVL